MLIQRELPDRHRNVILLLSFVHLKLTYHPGTYMKMIDSSSPITVDQPNHLGRG
jgi:hypothetical protein